MNSKMELCANENISVRVEMPISLYFHKIFDLLKNKKNHEHYSTIEIRGIESDIENGYILRATDSLCDEAARILTKEELVGPSLFFPHENINYLLELKAEIRRHKEWLKNNFVYILDSGVSKDDRSKVKCAEPEKTPSLTKEIGTLKELILETKKDIFEKDVNNFLYAFTEHVKSKNSTSDHTFILEYSTSKIKFIDFILKTFKDDPFFTLSLKPKDANKLTITIEY